MVEIVGITGRKFHGKDTVAREFAAHGYTVMRFAGPLKAMLRTFYAEHGVSPETIERKLEGDLKEEPCIYLSGKTPRHAMQTLGTQWGRMCIADDIWTKSLGYRAALHEKVVVPDVRFPNECMVIDRLGGAVWRVDASIRVPPNKYSDHESEKHVDLLPVDLEIDNNGRVVELVHAVETAIGGWPPE